MVRMWHTSLCDPILSLAVELYFQGILQKFAGCALQAYETYFIFVLLRLQLLLSLPRTFPDENADLPGASLSGCRGMRFAGYASAEIRCLERRDKNQREIKDCGMSIYVISHVFFIHTSQKLWEMNNFYISNVLLIDMNVDDFWHLHAVLKYDDLHWPPW